MHTVTLEQVLKRDLMGLKAREAVRGSINRKLDRTHYCIVESIDRFGTEEILLTDSEGDAWRKVNSLIGIEGMRACFWRRQDYDKIEHMPPNFEYLVFFYIGDTIVHSSRGWGTLELSQVLAIWREEKVTIYYGVGGGRKWRQLNRVMENLNKEQRDRYDYVANVSDSFDDTDVIRFVFTGEL